MAYTNPHLVTFARRYRLRRVVLALGRGALRGAVVGLLIGAGAWLVWFWAAWIIGAAGLAGVVVGMLAAGVDAWRFYRGRGFERALAHQIDARCGLQDGVASVLSLPPSPFAKALAKQVDEQLEGAALDALLPKLNGQHLTAALGMVLVCVLAIVVVNDDQRQALSEQVKQAIASIAPTPEVEEPPPSGQSEGAGHGEEGGQAGASEDQGQGEGDNDSAGENSGAAKDGAADANSEAMAEDGGEGKAEEGNGEAEDQGEDKGRGEAEAQGEGQGKAPAPAPEAEGEPQDGAANSNDLRDLVVESTPERVNNVEGKKLELKERKPWEAQEPPPEDESQANPAPDEPPRRRRASNGGLEERKDTRPVEEKPFAITPDARKGDTLTLLAEKDVYDPRSSVRPTKENSVAIPEAAQAPPHENPGHAVLSPAEREFALRWALKYKQRTR